MDIIYFTLAALMLYVGSDWILTKIEAARGGPFKHRSLIFFAIILILSMTSFNAIDYLTRKPATTTETTNSTVDTTPANTQP